MVGINTSWPNKIVEEALNADKIVELTGYETIRREVKYGENSRIDFLLESEDRATCYVEVKSITFSRTQGLAEFPDAKTARGTKHLREMTTMVEAGARAVMLYIVQRNDCDHFQIAADVDPEYQQVLTKAQFAGVESLCYACHMSPEEISVSHAITMNK